MKHARIHYPMLVLLVTFLAVPSVRSQTNFWQSSLPGNDFFSFTFTQSGTVLASPGEVLNSSTDDGQTWQSSTPASPFFFFSLATAPNGEIYAGGPGVMRSTDNGGSWNSLPGSNDFHVDAIAVRPNGHVFVGTATGLNSSPGGIFRSTDDGQTWKRLILGATLRYTEVPAFIVTNSGNLVASTYNSVNRVYMTKNDGHSWRSLSLPVSHNWWWVFGIASNGDLLAAGGVKNSEGIVPTLYRSSNDGFRWRKISAFPGLNAVTSIAATANGDIFVSSYGGGVYRSSDNAVSFAQVNSGLPTNTVRKIGVSPNGYLYALTDAGVFRSQQPVGIPASVSNHTPSREIIAPEQFALDQNYPNPFNPTTTIGFELAGDALVTATVYNTLGQEVATLADHEQFGEGSNELEFDGSNLPSGAYFYRIVAQGIGDPDEGTVGQYMVSTKKMLLVK